MPDPKEFLTIGERATKAGLGQPYYLNPETLEPERYGRPEDHPYPRTIWIKKGKQRVVVHSAEEEQRVMAEHPKPGVPYRKKEPADGTG